MILKNGVSAILICLNDGHCIKKMLDSLNVSPPDELIIVDGGSSDNTREIAQEYTPYVFNAAMGMLSQTLLGLSKASFNKILLIEADHIYPVNFVEDLTAEFIKSGYNGIAAQMIYTNKSNFFERGLAQTYLVHCAKKGIKDIIACPQLWSHEDISKLLFATKNAQGYSFDTQRAEETKKLRLKVGMGYTAAYEEQPITFKKFFQRHRNYGHGDYDFYTHNYNSWGALRKIKSLTHILIRYGLIYPIKSFRHGNPLIAIPYFWLVVIFRYAAWVEKAIIKSAIFKLQK